MEDMGTFRVRLEIEDPANRGTRIAVDRVLVDTGAELSSFPAATLEALGVERVKSKRFRQATGTTFERDTGFVIIHAAGTKTVDEVVFGEPGDIVLLGARSLEGLNLVVDPATKQLMDSGPMPMASAA